jgi:dTDP-4-amino-4,6-dideoxygalactose transaminase
MDQVPLSYTPIDTEKLNEVLTSYSGRSHQDIIVDFEHCLSQVTGARYVVALNSGTAAIHLGLKALNVERDDLVIGPTFTYVASLNPVLYQNAIPLLVDCERNTWGLDPVLVEDVIRKSAKKPKAIIVVHNYGYPARVNELKSLSEKYEIPMLEDAAEALGSTYQNKHVGTFGEVGILSFNNNKIITTYGGGAVITNNETIFRKVSYWASQSREDKPYYEHQEVGYNYRMSPLNAAVGLALMPGLKAGMENRKADFNRYRKALEPAGAVFLEELAGFQSNHWFTTLLLPDACSPARAKKALEERGIESRFLWNPMHRQPLFKDQYIRDAGISDNLFSRGICLPAGAISGDQHDKITTILKELF